ncbi:MAG: acetylglutamate kinase [Thermoanaerobaculia bacterium]
MKDVGQRSDRMTEVAGLKHALPYLRLFQGKTFVVKVSGEALADEVRLLQFLEQIEVLHRLGIRIVLVHGGGPQTTALAARLGLTTEKIDGRRVTDAATLEAAIMATAGQANTLLLAACRKAGVAAVGLSGVDASLVEARRRAPGRIDYGFVGDVETVNPRVIEKLLGEGYVPVIAPLAAQSSAAGGNAEDAATADLAGTILNVNADTIAAEIAVSLAAEKLLFAAAVPGLLERGDDPSSLVSLIDLAGLAELETSGGMTAGMLPKARAIVRAIEGGVPRVHLVPFAVGDALLVELFTNEGIGTLVVRDVAALAPAAGRETVARV